MRRGLAAALACVAFLATSGASAQTFRSNEHSFRVVRLVEGLEHPWSLAFLPDGTMLVTERPGRLRIVHKMRDGRLQPQLVAGLPKVEAYGQGGLFDVVLHPRYAENRWKPLHPKQPKTSFGCFDARRCKQARLLAGGKRQRVIKMRERGVEVRGEPDTSATRGAHNAVLA